MDLEEQRILCFVGNYHLEAMVVLMHTLKTCSVCVHVCWPLMPLLPCVCQVLKSLADEEFQPQDIALFNDWVLLSLQDQSDEPKEDKKALEI